VPPHCNLAYIFNPKLTVLELLETVCHEFGVAVTPPAQRPATVKDYLDPLNAFLLQAHAAGRNNVLVIDEAQNLAPEVLEQLRLLTNLETSERKLLQIILIGQPELREMLARPELEQLAQRVIARYHLQALARRRPRSTCGTGWSVRPAAAAAVRPRALRRIHRSRRRAAAHQPAVRPRAAGRLRQRPGAGHAAHRATRPRRRFRARHGPPGLAAHRAGRALGSRPAPASWPPSPAAELPPAAPCAGRSPPRRPHAKSRRCRLRRAAGRAAAPRRRVVRRRRRPRHAAARRAAGLARAGAGLEAAGRRRRCLRRWPASRSSASRRR
jgi:general secretion pathway protein A